MNTNLDTSSESHWNQHKALLFKTITHKIHLIVSHLELKSFLPDLMGSLLFYEMLNAPGDLENPKTDPVTSMFQVQQKVKNANKKQQHQ